MTMTAVPLADDELRLREVLATGLPRTLCTSEAPASYAVSFVVTRRVHPSEITRIESPEASRALAGLGFPGIHLAVADRRLIVSPTTLEELADGLAGALSEVLHDIEHGLARDREDRQRLAEESQRSEDVRMAGVQRLLSAIDIGFVRAHPAEDHWDDDGGSGAGAHRQ